MPYHAGIVQGKTLAERLDLTVAELGLPVRTVNALDNHLGVLYVSQLLEKTEDQLLGVPNIGRAALNGIYKALKQWGFYKKR